MNKVLCAYNYQFHIASKLDEQQHLPELILSRSGYRVSNDLFGPNCFLGVNHIFAFLTFSSYF